MKILFYLLFVGALVELALGNSLMVASFAPNNEGKGDPVERRDQVMMIRTKTESVYYPVSKQRADLICGSGRIRHLRGLVVVNPKNLKRRLESR